jgi:pyroglutamyl-peptidase
MKTVLVTGFGAFPGAPFNPTKSLAANLVRRRRPAFADVKLVSHIFETSYAAVDRDLPMLVERNRPDAIVMFGLATRTKHVRIECVARNRKTTLLPDVAGAVATTMVLDRRAPSILSGRAPFARLLAAARSSGVPVAYSRNAGRYLCNYAYWRALRLAQAPNGPRVVFFVHVPIVARPAPGPTALQRRHVSTQDLRRMAEAILRATIAAL